MSRLEDFEWMIHYLKVLDPVNAKILTGLGKFGPRNTSFLARSLKLPATTVAFRIKKLIRKGFLQVRTNLDHSKLGLMRAVLLGEAAGRLEKLRRAVENVGYWTYIADCYGKFNGIYALFAFPVEYKDRLEAYLRKVARSNVMSSYVFFWTANLCEVPRNFDWFDFKEKAWRFPWQQWTNEVLRAAAKPPSSLLEPEKYQVSVDETDLFLLKEFEKNAFVAFTKIAGILRMSPQGVRYRYYKHVVERGLISDYQIAIFPYPILVSDMASFVLHFRNQEALAKFTNTLPNKPFILSYGKIISQNSLVMHSYTPKTEFPHLIKVLDSLVESNIIADFFHVNLDIPSFARQTVSYEFFRNESWVFNYDGKLRRLAEIARS